MKAKDLFIGKTINNNHQVRNGCWNKIFEVRESANVSNQYLSLLKIMNKKIMESEILNANYILI